MLLRNLWAEIADLLARPVQWVSIVVVCAVVLAGVDQLALDTSAVKILVIDNDVDQEQGGRIADLISQLSGLKPLLPAGPIPEDLIDRTDADIVIHKSKDLWRATVRPRSILDHRRLSRLGFSLAAVINRATPWDTVMSAESMSRRDHGRTMCEIGERMCAIFKSSGHPQYEVMCLAPSEFKASALYAFEEAVLPCRESKTPVLRDALEFSYRLANFCDENLIDPERSRGICNSPKAPIIGSVVSMVANPQSHTRVFIPRTICLLAVFVAFVVCCRSWMQETKFNTWPALAALQHGSIANLLISKILTSSLFALSLTIVMLEFSSYLFDIGIKPGIVVNLVPVALAILSSAVLGLAVSLVTKNEVSAYVIASLYLLMLFVLSGYIDELKESTSAVSLAAYVLPLRYIMSPFSSWMTFGSSPPLQETLAPLLSQFAGSLVLLLLARQLHRHRS